MWTEFFGTLVLLSVALRTSSSQLLPLCISFASLAYLGNGELQMNPAISTMFFVDGVIPVGKWLMYVVVQITAGLVAVGMRNVIGL